MIACRVSDPPVGMDGSSGFSPIAPPGSAPVASRSAAVILRALVLAAWWLVWQPALAERSHYQCSYYLFEVPETATGCSDCYIPLIVAPGSIEGRRDQEVVVMTTYERDSIWQVRREVLKSADLAIDVSARRIKFGGKTYRYQLVSNSEPVRLLKNPMGTIPVHRIWHPRIVDDGLWDVLLNDLSMAAAAEPCAAGTRDEAPESSR